MKIADVNVVMHKHRLRVLLWIYSKIRNVLKTVENRPNTCSKNDILTPLTIFFGIFYGQKLDFVYTKILKLKILIN